MRTEGGSKPEVITAKWKTALDSNEEHLGTIALDDEFQLRFPMLRSRDEIPPGTTVLWGLTDRLRRCTALTLPFGPHGWASGQAERLLFTSGIIRQLLVGQNYIADPTNDFVSEIIFTPEPNKDLYVSQLFEFIQPRKDILEIKFAPSCSLDPTSFASADMAYFLPERGALFEASPTLPLGATVSAWIGGSFSSNLRSGFESCVTFCLRFETPRNMETALDEALILCAFLSFLAHQYVYPTRLRVRAADDDETYELHCRNFHKASERGHTSVGHTLVLPDKQPAQFCEALQKWYATNDEYLRSRYLYRHSLEEPNTYSTGRFLAIFQALEGIIRTSQYQFLTRDEMNLAEAALRQALPAAVKLEALIGKLRSNNTGSAAYVLKQELPKIFITSNISPSFKVNEFVDRVYMRRNKSSHGGAHLDKEPSEGLISDTLLLTAIYLIVESRQLGLDVHDALKKFRSSFLYLKVAPKVKTIFGAE